MKISDFISNVYNEYSLLSGVSFDVAKLGSTAFDVLRAELGVVGDENYIDLPNSVIEVELRPINSFDIVICWGDGTPDYSVPYWEVEKGQKDHTHAIVQWNSHNNGGNLAAALGMPPTPLNSFPPQVFNPSIYHYTSPHFFMPSSGGKVQFSSPAQDTHAAKTPACSHTWQKYQGLNTIDYTCTKCNERRDTLP